MAQLAIDSASLEYCTQNTELDVTSVCGKVTVLHELCDDVDGGSTTHPIQLHQVRVGQLSVMTGNRVTHGQVKTRIIAEKYTHMHKHKLFYGSVIIKKS